MDWSPLSAPASTRTFFDPWPPPPLSSPSLPLSSPSRPSRSKAAPLELKRGRKVSMSVNVHNLTQRGWRLLGRAGLI